MDILISFYNTFKTPGFPSLGLLNASTMDLRIVDLPVELPNTGIGGLVLGSQFVFMALQHSFDGTSKESFYGTHQHTLNEAKTYASPPALLVFDRHNFRLIHYYIFKQASDVHSLLLSDDENNLYAVSTGTDEVFKLALDGTGVITEEVFWRPEANGKRSDNYHLNSIYKWHDDIYVSGFGKKADGISWNTALNGFIHNITQNKEVIAGLEHPHSVHVINGEMAFCESRRRRLRFVGNENSVQLPGYVRGLCSAGDKLFVGTSARRQKSKSTGKVVEASDNESWECTISRIDSKTLEIDVTLNLKDYGYEIYDLLTVEGMSLWPAHPPINYRLQVEELWAKQVNSSLEEVQHVIPKGERIILVDENTWRIDQEDFPNYQFFHFVERDNKYWGAPENDDRAILELKRMQQKGARFIAFGWPAFWWLDHYSGFSNFLRQEQDCIFENDHLIIFQLKDQSN